jgi:hypothetical protein
MNGSQTAAVNLVVGAAGVLAMALEPGLRQVLAPLRSSPALLAVGVAVVGVIVVGARAERRLERTGVTAVGGVLALVPVLAAGYAVSGVAGVRVTILLGMVGLAGVSAVQLVRTVAGAPATAGAE